MRKRLVARSSRRTWVGTGWGFTDSRPLTGSSTDISTSVSSAASTPGTRRCRTRGPFSAERTWRRFGLRPDQTERREVVFVGRILPHKGLNYLVEAIDPDITFAIVGRRWRHAGTFNQLLMKLAERETDSLRRGPTIQKGVWAPSVEVSRHCRHAAKCPLRRSLFQIFATRPSSASGTTSLNCSVSSSSKAWLAAPRPSSRTSAACPKSSSTAKPASWFRRTMPAPCARNPLATRAPQRGGDDLGRGREEQRVLDVFTSGSSSWIAVSRPTAFLPNVIGERNRHDRAADICGDPSCETGRTPPCPSTSMELYLNWR